VRLSIKKFSLIFIGILGIFIIFWTLWIGVSFYTQRQKAKRDTTERGYLKGITLESIREGKLIWRLFAEKAKIKGSSAFLWGIKIEYFYKDEKPINIFATEGNLDKKKKIGVIKGDVKIVYEKETLYTSEIKWFFEKNLIESTKSFYMDGKYRVEGVGFLAKPRIGWIQVKRLKKAVF